MRRGGPASRLSGPTFAWWRTGLTTFAVSLAAGKLVPVLSSGAGGPFEAIGIAFAVVGLLFIAYAYVRQKQDEEALARGEYGLRRIGTDARDGDDGRHPRATAVA